MKIEPIEQNITNKTKAPDKKALLISTAMSMVPLVVYWIIESNFGLIAGVYAAMAAGLIELLYTRIRYKHIDKIVLGGTVLVIIMGLLSLYYNSGIFIKLKPAIFEFIFAGVLFVSWIVDKPLMVVMAKKQAGGVIENSFQLKYLKGITLRLSILFLIHGIITVYAAIYLSTGQWILVKGVLFYVLSAAMMLGEYIYLRRWKKKQTRDNPIIYDTRIKGENDEI